MDQQVGVVTLKVEILQVYFKAVRAGAHDILARRYAGWKRKNPVLVRPRPSEQVLNGRFLASGFEKPH